MIAQTINELGKSDKRIDKLYYIAELREWAKIGQRLYKLQPESWLKDWLIKLYNYIKQYAKNI